MLRIVSIVVLTLISLGVATAGQIAVNLTTASLGYATCSDASAPCTPNVTTFNTNTYLNNTYGSLVLSGAPAPSAYASPTTTNAPIMNGTANVPFYLVTQSASSINPGDDAVYGANTASLNSSLVVDLGTCSGIVGGTSSCGVFDVGNVYTLIQANGDAFGFQGVTVTLNGYNPNTSSAVTDTIVLTSGVDFRGTNNLVGVQDCTDANSNNPTNNVTTGCSNATNLNSKQTGTDLNPGGTSGNTVVTYNSAFGASGATDYFMDVQELELGQNLAGDYLDSITFTSDSTVGAKDRMLLSGVTVSTTPEPGTIALLALGLGLIAFWKIRSRRATVFSAAKD